MVCSNQLVIHLISGLCVIDVYYAGRGNSGSEGGDEGERGGKEKEGVCNPRVHSLSTYPQIITLGWFFVGQEESREVVVVVVVLVVRVDQRGGSFMTWMKNRCDSLPGEMDGTCPGMR